MKNTVKYVSAENGTLGYMLSVPELPTEDLPLLVYLHGAGERGANLTHLGRHAIPKMLEEGKRFDAVVLCPQCPSDFVWNNVIREVKELIDQIVETYRISKDRISLTGSSMGGYGTWEMGTTYRNFFSAIAPVCGGGMPWRASNLITTPVRSWHGDEDETVLLVNSEIMVNAVNQNGGSASLTVLKGFGHNDGIEEAYTNTDLISWLLNQRRTDFSVIPEALSEFF